MSTCLSSATIESESGGTQGKGHVDMTTPQGNFDPLNNNDYSKLDGSIPFLSRKLRRSKTDSMLVGVLGGIAETYGIDATLLRLVFVIAAVCFPIVPVIYLVAAVLMWNT